LPPAQFHASDKGIVPAGNRSIIVPSRRRMRARRCASSGRPSFYHR
jgi:hypothetical protein